MIDDINEIRQLSAELRAWVNMRLKDEDDIQRFMKIVHALEAIAERLAARMFEP